MSPNKYTKATSFSRVTFGTKQDTQDAVYIGEGNFEENVTASELFSPKLWLKANDGPTYAGYPLVVATWVDKSGNSHDGSIISGKEPRKQVNASPILNGLVTMDFDRTGDDETIKIADHADFDFDGDFEMMAIAKWDATNGNSCIIAKDKHSSKWTWINDDGIMKFHVSGNDGIGSATISTDTWYIVGVNRASDTIQMWLNGATDGSSVSNTNDFTGTDDVYVGARLDSAPDTTGQGTDGEIAEILVWKKALNTTERAFIVTYLQDKWLNYPPPADIQLTLDGATTIYRRQPAGQVINIKWDTIIAAETSALSVVGLKA
jgi:hypothetical protein